MTGTLSLAASIAAMSRSDLRALLGARRVAAPASIRDPLSLAIDLLRPESVTRALSTVDRHGLTALKSLGNENSIASDPTLEELRARGLVGFDAQSEAFVALPEVDSALQAALKEADISVSDSSQANPDSAPTRERADTSRWFGQALSSVRRSAAILRVLAAHPAKLSRKGAATATAVRSLSLATHGDVESTAQLVSVLQLAGLVTPLPATRSGAAPTLLVASATARDWLQQPYPERWVVLAEALAGSIEAELHRALELSENDLSTASTEVLRREYPLLPETVRADAAEYAAAAEVLGLATNGFLSPPAERLFDGDPVAALEIATRDIPAPADGVYLQPDLSIIVPGPLLPDDEQALSEITEAEQLGAAAALRLSPLSLARAVRRGHSTATIRALLERLSLTGIPQPLDFMITDLDRKLLDSPDSATLTTPESRLHGSWSDDNGKFAHPDSLALSDSAEAPDELDDLAELIHEAAQASSGEGSLTRQLELAIRDKSPVLVTAAAGADVRTFTLMPVALTGGRLRATDQIAGVERTLPVTAITKVALVQSGAASSASKA